MREIIWHVWLIRWRIWPLGAGSTMGAPSGLTCVSAMPLAGGAPSLAFFVSMEMFGRFEMVSRLSSELVPSERS